MKRFWSYRTRRTHSTSTLLRVDNLEAPLNEHLIRTVVNEWTHELILISKIDLGEVIIANFAPSLFSYLCRYFFSHDHIKFKFTNPSTTKLKLHVKLSIIRKSSKSNVKKVTLDRSQVPANCWIFDFALIFFAIPSTFFFWSQVSFEEYFVNYRRHATCCRRKWNESVFPWLRKVTVGSC